MYEADFSIYLIIYIIHTLLYYIEREVGICRNCLLGLINIVYGIFIYSPAKVDKAFFEIIEIHLASPLFV